eukprot:gnl/MRDRNA2_/MRDRNA2_92419_c0_seq1.p1 gnl/MRDRNA2_/MRDRNA2_92419_c0~~gnl/MRDRNA2_/MRDRNA2_92419_c0_seq1.p1  ORF type:complete len:357 (-),score=35.35 gnl/MRDRNA2_/MRDRNA2_92419_c0_seq1:88-1158(-)
MRASSGMCIRLPSGAGYGAAACLTFVFFGVTSTLCITASEVDGRLPYNTTSSVLVTEVLKFLLSCACWFFAREPGTDKKHDEPQRSTLSKLSLQTFFLYSIPGLMYAIQNQLLYYAVFHLQPALFQLLSNLKFVSTALLARFVMGKMLSFTQWLGILCLVLGSIVSRGSMLCSLWHQWATDDQVSLEGQEDGDSGKSLLVGVLLVISTSTISGISGIANEYLLKRVDSNTPFMLKNMQLYFWGIIFNVGGAIFESTGQGLFHGFNWWVWMVIGLKAAEGMSISFIMKYLDNIVKCFCSAILVYVMTICSKGLFDEQIDLFFVLGLAVITVALVLYFGLHNEVRMLGEAQRKVLGSL